MADWKESPKPSNRRKKTLRRAVKAKGNTVGQLPPNLNLQNPDETCGDMPLPSWRH